MIAKMIAEFYVFTITTGIYKFIINSNATQR